MNSLPPSQRPRCSVCSRPCVALIRSTHVLQYRSGPKRIEWDECWACYQAAERRGEQLKREAEEDRKVRLPPEKPRQRRESNSLSFIAQIEDTE